MPAPQYSAKKLEYRVDGNILFVRRGRSWSVFGTVKQIVFEKNSVHIQYDTNSEMRLQLTAKVL